MTIASEITRINDNISAAYTAAAAKGATMPLTQNSDNLATCISSISGGGSSGTYSLLQRITDDSNNEIGTVSGFFKDANNIEYAVVCLDAQYRLSSGQYLASGYGIPSVDAAMSSYNTVEVFESDDTSTSNTAKILDFASTNNTTSTACSHCRTQAFTIGGMVYAGQLPNILELVDIFKHRVALNTMDTSASLPNAITLTTVDNYWSSTQGTAASGWCITSTGNVTADNRSNSLVVVPVLEIPNTPVL